MRDPEYGKPSPLEFGIIAALVLVAILAAFVALREPLVRAQEAQEETTGVTFTDLGDYTGTTTSTLCVQDEAGARVCSKPRVTKYVNGRPLAASGMQLREDSTQIEAEAEGLQPDPKGDAQ